MARETAVTASSWPIKRWCRVSSMCSSFSDSDSVSLFTGIPVQEATIWAMSSSVTTGETSRSLPSDFLVAEIARIWALISISRSLNSPARSKSWDLTASSFSLSTWRSSLSNSFAAGGSWELIKRTLDPASSIKSIALSGRYRSEIYRSDSFAAATSASSEIFSLWCCS